MQDYESAKDPYFHENGFYLYSEPGRLGKLLIHYELYKRIVNLHGCFVEFGVFRGASLLRFLNLRELLEPSSHRKFFAFDTFGDFPQTRYQADIKKRLEFIETSGSQSLSESELDTLTRRLKLNRNLSTVAGNILETLPQFLWNNPELRFSIVNIDVDIYEPCKVILEKIYPRLVRGGVLILDDYGIFPGTTRAVDDYFSGSDIEIHASPYSPSPSWIIKQ